MRKHCTVIILALASLISASAVAGAQTNERPDAIELFPVSPAAQPLFTPDALDASIAQQPAGPPPTPRHTGIKALTKNLVTNFKYLPSKENLFWAAGGGGLALAVHPFDDDVNEKLVGNDTAEKIFKAGEVLGELGTLLGSASVVYAVGRIKDQPKVSHLGMEVGGRDHRGTYGDEPRSGASVSGRSSRGPRRHGHHVHASVQVGPLRYRTTNGPYCPCSPAWPRRG